MVELIIKDTWCTQVLHELYIMSRYGKQLSRYYDLTKNQIYYIKNLCEYFGFSYIFTKPIGIDKRKSDVFVMNWEVFPIIRYCILFNIFEYNILIYNDIIGALCGINRCCRNNYIKFSEKIDSDGAILTAKDYLKKIKDKKDPYKIYIKKDVVYYGDDGRLFNVINHIPCSPDCDYTRIKAKVYTNAWYDMVKFFNLKEHIENRKEFVLKLKD